MRGALSHRACEGYPGRQVSILSVETTGSATPSLVCGAGQQGVFSQLTDFHRVHGRMGPISHARVRLVRWRPVAAIAAMMAALIVMAGDSIPVRRSTIVLWAWERPEDLRFSGPDVGVAVLAGSIVLSGEAVRVTGRRYPALTLPGQRIVGVVHVEIDRREPLVWTQVQREATIARILGLADNPRFDEIQIDFEVRASERHVLLDLLRTLRPTLPAGHELSMTALASWCDTERWVGSAPVDYIVPMLFWMGATGENLKRRLAEGGDFADRNCRNSIGVAVDTPPYGLPPGRPVYVFNPHSWNRQALDLILRDLGK